MPKFTAEPTTSFKDLVKITHILRNNCPWDKKQTHESLKDLMVEEVYEAIETIDQGDFDGLKKELGDLLLHIVFHAEMAKEKEKFSIEDVIYAIQEKLIVRHPHVFDNVEVSSTDEVLKNWEAIKLKEKGRTSVLDGVPTVLPGLLKAQRMQEKAAGVGFDWQNWQQCWTKLREEIGEFEEAIAEDNQKEMENEFGDLLFALVNVGRHLNINAEDSLRLTNTKFKHRFNYIETQFRNKPEEMKKAGLEELDRFWNKAKSEGL